MESKKPTDLWGKDWAKEIEKAGIKLRHFNDVVTGYMAPGEGYGEPVARDVVLDGIICDIYHSDHKQGDTGHRVYIHKKG